MNRYNYDIISRALSRSIKQENGCILYRSEQLKHKYGLISITTNGKRKPVPAHRALWMAINDKFDLPSHIVIRHKCDNTRCVNIEHLVMGSHKDNTRDCIERGHKAKAHKLHTRQRKFTDEQIIEIRNCSDKIKDVAIKYNVSKGYVSKLRRGQAKTMV